MVKLIDFIVNWGPTLLFLAILAFGFLVGFVRGRRKSRLSLLHKIISASIAIAIFIIFTNFDFFNVKPMLKDIIIEAAGNSDKALGIALSDNFAYILAYVNLAYNLVFSVVACVIYWLFRIIFFFNYLLFYPNWRYKQKQNKKLNNNQAESIYKKKRLRGAFTGLIWSFFVGILALSSIGNLFYIVAGTGEEGLPDYSFKDETTNQLYQIIDSVESYGDSGVLKLLNSVKDSDEMPLYLYVGALPFSGKIEYSETQSERVYFTHELGNYVSFLMEVASITIKYNYDVFEGVLDGDSFTVDAVVTMLDEPSFRVEFRELLSNYATKSTFISNFLFSTIDSYVAHLDQSLIANSFDEQTKDLISILFVEGHVSNYIPYEKEHKNETYPCLKFSDLVSKSDLLAAYDLFIDLLDNGLFEENPDTIQLVLSALNHIENFRLFSPENKNRDNINGTLGRLYAYVEANVFEEEPANTLVNYSSHVNVRWIDEILELIDMAPELVDFYDALNDPEFANYDMAQLVEALFDKFQNQGLLSTYDKVTDYVTGSGLASTVISSRFIHGTIEDMLQNSFTNYTKPENLTLVNKIDAQGNVVYGEIYNFLRVLRCIVADETTKDIVVSILGADNDVNLFDLIKQGQEVLTKPDETTNKSIIQYLTNSDLLRSVISSFIITLSEPEDAFIYVPDSAREIDSEGNLTYIIREKEFTVLFNTIFSDYGENDVKKLGLIDVIDFNYFNKTEAHISELFIEGCGNLFENERIIAFLKDSLIIQASIGNVISDNRDTLHEDIILPETLYDPNNWITKYNDQGEIISSSELLRLFDALYEVLGDTRELLDQNFTEDSLLEISRITDLNHPSKVKDYKDKGLTSLDIVLTSQLLYHNISNLVSDLPDYFDFEDEENNLYDALVDGIEASKSPETGLITVKEFKNFINVIDVIFRLDSNDSTNDIEDLANKIEVLFEDVGKILKPLDYGMNFDGKSFKDKPLNVFYNSTIIKYFFSVSIDNTLVSIMGEDDVDYQKLVYVKQDGVYTLKDTQDLLEGLVVCLEEANFDNAGNELIDIFTSLQDEVGHAEYDYIFDKGESSTKLAKLYNSCIMEIVLTDLLQEQVEKNDLLQDHPDAYVSINDGLYRVYKLQEISTLIDMFNEVSGTTSDDLDFDNFDTSSLHLDTFKTLLFGNVTNSSQATVKSKILYSTISKNVLENDFVVGTETVKPQIIIPDISIDSTVESVDGNGTIDLILESELYLLLDFACEVNVVSVDDFGDFDAKLDDFDLSTVKPYITDSNILRATVSDKLFVVSNDTGSLIIPDFTLEPDVSVKMIKSGEINNLIDFSVKLGISTVGDVTGEDSAFTDNHNFNLSTISEFIYPLDKRADSSFNPNLNTNIVRATLSDKIITLTTNLGSADDLLQYPKDVISSLIQTSDNGIENLYKLIETNELISLIDAVESVLDDGSALDTFDSIKVDEFTLYDAEELIKDSLIIRSTTSMKLVEGDTNYMVVPFSAKELKSGTTDVYVEQTIVETKESGINGEDIFVITLEELQKLFDALEAMGVDNVSNAHDVDEDTLDPKHYGEGISKIVSKSAILRATITEHVSFEDEFGDIAIRSLLSEIDVNISAINNTSKVNVLHDHEIEHLLDGFTKYNLEKSDGDTSGAFTCSLSIELLQTLYNNGESGNALSVMLTSDIFRISICELLNKTPFITIPTTTNEVFCFDNGQTISMELSSKLDIENCIAALPIAP